MFIFKKLINNLYILLQMQECIKIVHPAVMIESIDYSMLIPNYFNRFPTMHVAFKKITYQWSFLNCKKPDY